MKNLKIFSFILAAASLMMTSCLKSDNNSITTKSSLAYVFNAVLDQQSGDMTYYTGTSVEVEWEHVDATADVKIIGLTLPDAGKYPTLEFNSVPWKYNSMGWQDITFSDGKPGSSTGYVSNLVFDRFNFQIASRSYQNMAFPPCFNVSYTINNRYRVFTLPLEIIEVGETSVTSPDGTIYRQDDQDRSIYYVELDPAKKSAFIVVQGAKFAQGMPALNMKFPGIPFSVGANGTISMEIDELTPAILKAENGTVDINQAGQPYPSFPITNLRLSYVPSVGLTLSFNCNAMGTLYYVNMVSKFPSLANNSQNQ